MMEIDRGEKEEKRYGQIKNYPIREEDTRKRQLHIEERGENRYGETAI